MDEGGREGGKQGGQQNHTCNTSVFQSGPYAAPSVVSAPIHTLLPVFSSISPICRASLSSCWTTAAFSSSFCSQGNLGEDGGEGGKKEGEE